MIGANGKKCTKAFSMIKKIKRSALDLEKYTACLQRSINYRVYAEYWYLDILMESQWDCLVLNDYEAIMPLPYIRKFGIKFIAQPVYCQQLGVFHSENFTKELFDLFEKKLHRNLVKAYRFNEENTSMFHPKGNLRTNFILDLNRPHSTIFENYTPNRKKELRRTSRMQLTIKEVNNLSHFESLKRQYEYISQHKLENKFNIIFQQLIERKVLNVYDIFSKENELIGSQLILDSKNRKICLSFARNKAIEKHNASAFILDYVIQQYAEKPFLLDFEGSIMPEVAKFMKGYSPKAHQYTGYQNIPKFK